MKSKLSCANILEFLLKFIGDLFSPSLPPFQNGQKIIYNFSSPCYGYVVGQEYTVSSQFLSINKDKWFVRTEENPASTYASDFVSA